MLVLAGAARGQLPIQPTGLTAIHRDGQTFLTWTASADPAVRAYQVYRSDQPIDAGSLASSVPIQRVTRDSSRFYADRYDTTGDGHLSGNGNWVARYLERFVIEDNGPELAADQELLVWTIAEADVGAAGSGHGYYAVTTIRDDQVENTTDFGPDNAIGPLVESIAPPRPVVAKTLPLTGGTVLIQYLDLRRFNATKAAPNQANSYYGFDPADAAVSEALQYAFTYVVFPPDVGVCASVDSAYPAVVVLHGYGPGFPRPYASFEPKSDWCTAYRIYPLDPTNSWWFGFAEQFDYRTGLVPPAGDVIRNYTEQRVLRMVDDLIADPMPGMPVDPDRVYLVGQSMGGTGTLAMALRYPQVFAAAHAGQPMTRPATAGDAGGDPWGPILERGYGAEADQLPYLVDADLPYQAPLAAASGTSVWDWQDHQATLAARSALDRVPLGIDHGLHDMVIEWQTQGEPLYPPLDGAALCWAGEITNTGHISSNQSTLPGAMAKLAGRPFVDFTVVRDETVPGFFGSSANLPLPPTSPGFFNANLEWSASWDAWDGAPVDSEDEWVVALRSTTSPATVRVTPRRTQVFAPQPGEVLRWQNERVADDSIVQSGTLVVPGDGVPLSGDFNVSLAGNRVRFERPLVGDVDSISLAAGGAQTLGLRYGADRAGDFYVVLGSVSGTSPGLPLVDGTVLPLVVSDPYFQTLLAAPNQPFLSPSLATLDASGEATCVFSLPPASPPSLAGTTVHHAAAVVSIFGPQAVLASQPVALELLP